MRLEDFELKSEANFYEPLYQLPQVETPRLILRRMKLSDAKDLYDYAKDPLVTRYVMWDAHRTIADSLHFLRCARRQYRLGPCASWGVICKETGRMIGTIGFMQANAEHMYAEVGYSIARAYWNRGLATEALQAVLRYAFEETDVHRIEADHLPENPASGRVMEKCGMQREGLLRGRVLCKGQFRDVYLYSIIKDRQ